MCRLLGTVDLVYWAVRLCRTAEERREQRLEQRRTRITVFVLVGGCNQGRP